MSADPGDCFDRRLVQRLEPQELAELWALLGEEATLCSLTLKYALERVNPELAPQYLNDVFVALHEYKVRTTFYQLVVESAVKRQIVEGGPWIELFVLSLDPALLFDPTGSDINILVAGHCVKANPDLLQDLTDGARGAWGGNSAQLHRTIAVCFSLLVREPEEFHSFAASLLASPTLPMDPQLGGHIAAMLTFRQHVEVLSGLNCARLLNQLLSDSRCERGAARQLYSMYTASPPLGFSAEEWNGVWLRVEYLLQAQ